MSNELTTSNADILASTEGGRKIGENILILPAQGNALAIKTSAGVTIVDAGPGGSVTRNMIALLREWTQLPVKHICYSHGHAGYNNGVPVWVAHAEERGDAAPMQIAQHNLLARYQRYRETSQLQSVLNRIQFPQMPSSDARKTLIDPTLTFDDSMVLPETQGRIVIFAAPSETDDALCLWFAAEKVLYAGAALPGTTIPNIGTPLRTQRLAVRWAESLDRMIALAPRVLITEFGEIIEGEAEVLHVLTTTARALRWLREQVVARMNRGMTDVEIIHDLDYPDELFNWNWMRERYGAKDYIVRDIYRQENGWWDRNATSLHPAHPDDSARVIAAAISDKQAVIEQAKQLAAAGNVQLALHVIDLIALAPDNEPWTQAARQVKHDLCLQRSKEVRPYVSKALYESYAQLIASGKRRWSES